MQTTDPHKTSDHHRRSVRLKGYDYGFPGAYFVTLVAKDRACLFGEVVEGEVRLSQAGKIVKAEWQSLPNHFPNIRLGVFVVMPNHLHGIIEIVEIVGATRPAPDSKQVNSASMPAQAKSSIEGSPLPRPKGPLSGSLGAMIAQFKSRITKRIWASQSVARPAIWQRNYYEHIIRNEEDFRHVYEYILDNPHRWEEDEYHPPKSQSLEYSFP